MRSARVTSLLVLKMPLVVLTCRLTAVVGREGGGATWSSTVLLALLLLESTGDTGSSSSPATARRRDAAECGRDVVGMATCVWAMGQDVMGQVSKMMLGWGGCRGYLFSTFACSCFAMARTSLLLQDGVSAAVSRNKTLPSVDLPRGGECCLPFTGKTKGNVSKSCSVTKKERKQWQSVNPACSCGSTPKTPSCILQCGFVTQHV